MTLACGPDNRAVDDGGWQTRINSRGECEWTAATRPGPRPIPNQLLPPPRSPPQTDRRRGATRSEGATRTQATETEQTQRRRLQPLGPRHQRDTRRPGTTRRSSSMNPGSRYDALGPAGTTINSCGRVFTGSAPSAVTMTMPSMQRKPLLGSHIGQIDALGPAVIVERVLGSNCSIAAAINAANTHRRSRSI